MKVYAVIDTNVIISSMLTHNTASPTKIVMAYVRDGVIVPMINDDILEEYADVLTRTKFSFAHEAVSEMLKLFNVRGNVSLPECLTWDFIDPNDVIFYETYHTRDDAYLVTGNMRHFPSEPRIVTPADMISIMQVSGRMLSETSCEYISDSKREQLQRAWDAVERMRASALANGLADMSMEEIDEEIRQYREEKMLKRRQSV